MLNILKNQHRLYQTKFSFGATSAIITNLALITALNTLENPKLSIIGSMLLIALADNISDSLGIHIYQESECIRKKEVWLSTLTNFLARLFVSLTFILLVAMLPIDLAVLCSVIWGLSLLAVMSYAIAKNSGVNLFLAVSEHISIAVIVITASHLAGKWVIGRF